VNGEKIAGSTLVLRGDESTGGGLKFKWAQVSGPEILPRDADGPEVKVSLPSDGQPVEVLLIVANEFGIDTDALTIGDDARGGRIDSSPRADAGDDQLSVAGRQVTLSGARSEPKGNLGYRWVQVAGPKIRLKLEEGPFFSFVPPVPGVYRFALVVGSNSRVSEPDEAVVTVGAMTSVGAAPAAVPPQVVEPDSLDQIARRCLGLIHPKPETIQQLARAFDDMAIRMDVYEDYASMFRELSQRLDLIIPSGADRRAVWMDRVFNPMTTALIRVMQEEGLDLSRPEGQGVPFNNPQRARLAEQFRLIAEGFRAVGGEQEKSSKLQLARPEGGAIGALEQAR
jgi:hypothetical protein